MQEIDELVAEWRPVPLVPEDGLAQVAVRTPVVDCMPGARFTVDGVDGVLNLASYNFWGIVQQGHPQVPPPRLFLRARRAACALAEHCFAHMHAATVSRDAHGRYSG